LKDVFKNNVGWTPLEHKAYDIKIDLKKTSSGFNMCRSVGSIDYPAVDVFRFMNYFPMVSQWNLNCETNGHVSKLGVNAYITYQKTKKAYVVSSRDFVVNYLCNQEEDGTIMYVATSANCHYKIPEKPATVRADTILAGVILKPNPIDPSKTIFQKITEVDLKGIPEWVLKGPMRDEGL